MGKFFCFSNSKILYFNEITKFLSRFFAFYELFRVDNSCKILCFSQSSYYEDKLIHGFNLPRMWAQYGDNHTGVCIEIEKQKFIDENNFKSEDLINREIVYINKIGIPPCNIQKIMDVGEEEYFKEFIKDNLQALFFSKNIDWRTESEYRVVFFGDEHYCSIKNSLNRIILGVDFKICYYPAIYEASKDIQISQLFYESGDFVLKNNFLNLPYVQ